MSDIEHPMDMFQGAVGEWGAQTFPDTNDKKILAHLRDEVDELDEVLKGRFWPGGKRRVVADDVGEELADVFLMLLHLAHRHGISLRDQAERKFGIVQTRTYTTETEKGYLRHDDPDDVRHPIGPPDPERDSYVWSKEVGDE